MTLPPVTSLECVRALLKFGYSIRKQLNGALSLERPGRIVVVPMGRVLGEEALLLILLAARVSREEFLAALDPAVSGEHAIAGEGEASAGKAGRHTA